MATWADSSLARATANPALNRSGWAWPGCEVSLLRASICEDLVMLLELWGMGWVVGHG